MKKQHVCVRCMIAYLSLIVSLLGLTTGNTCGYSGRNAVLAHATMRPHTVSVYPRYKMVGSVPTHSGPFQAQYLCQDNAAAQRCYDPLHIRNAYDITRAWDAGYKGDGRTIAIIDAYQSPTIQSDLDEFDRLFNLPATDLAIVAPDGLAPFDGKSTIQLMWANEITLDVEWAHAIAPAAKIVLVLARSGQDTDIISALQYTVEHDLGDVISQSYGEAEACMEKQILSLEHQLFKQASAKGITLLAASGDTGAAQLACDGSAYIQSTNIPASDPLVTAVGGTYLNVDEQTGQYIGEAGWNDSYGSSGGGVSTIFARPLYQNGFTHAKMRSVPDIAFDASVNSGFLIVWSSSGMGANKIFQVGGTSAGAPQWAGIIALVDQYLGSRVGFINHILYQDFAWAHYNAFFHDITVGNNTYTGLTSSDVAIIPGYDTEPGWDAVTGLGTPMVGNSLLPGSGLQWSNWLAHSSDLKDISD